jgi:polynucleotide 5'-kinase involved in rRNA processing
VPRLDASAARDAGKLATGLIAEDPLHDERVEMIEYYLGDISPGASLQRFLEACRRLSARRDELWEKLQRIEGADGGEGA